MNFTAKTHGLLHSHFFSFRFLAVATSTLVLTLFGTAQQPTNLPATPPSDFSVSTTATPAGSSFVFAGDFNGDGIADVAAPGTDGVFRTYFGSPSGTFQAPVASSGSASFAFNVLPVNAVGDFDGDRHQDILLKNQVLYGNGDGTFKSVAMALIGNGQPGLVADLNGDGKSDLLSVSGLQIGAGSYNYYYTLDAQLGTSQRTFIPMSTNLGVYPTGSGITVPALLAAGDVNGDGIADVAIFDPNVNALEIWLGNGDGSFRAGLQDSLNGVAWSPQGSGGQGVSTGLGFIADLDGDGNQDLAFLATQSISNNNSVMSVLVIEYGNGSGGFSSTQVIPLSYGYSSMVPMRLAGEALPGIGLDNGSILGTNSIVAVLRNLGNREFSNEQFYNPGPSVGIIAGDFNGDGLSDLLLTASDPNESGGTPPSSFTVLLNRSGATGNGQALSNGALSASPSAVNYNQPFSLTAAVQPAQAGEPVPTGTVTFSTASTTFGSAQLSSGSATLQVSGTTTQQLPSGILPISATYSGDSVYASSRMITDLVIAEPQYVTASTLTITSGGSPVTSIQAGSFLTMTVSVSAPVAVPHGVIAFFDGTTVLGHAEIASGGATFTTNLLGPGTHQLSAQYMGFVPANPEQGTNVFLSSSSAALVLTVTSIPTTTVLNPSSSTVTAGAVLTLTAQVTSSSGTPIGGVTFYDGTSALGTYSLDSTGTASYSTASLSIGSHAFSAQYALNGQWASSTSTQTNVTANRVAAGFAGTTTLIAAVTPVSSSSLLASIYVSGGSPSQGSVTLLVDGQIAASASLGSSGVLSLPFQIRDAAVHHLVASYSGSSATAPSASPQLDTTSYLLGQDFTLQAAQTQASMPSSGPSIPVTLQIGSIEGWSDAVTLSCVNGAPAGYSCIFSPDNLTGPGTVTLVLVPQTGVATLGLLLLPGLWLLRKRSRRHPLTAVVLFGSLIVLSGCGNIPGAQAAKSWVVTIQGVSGNATHSTQVEFISEGAH